ncbi:XAP5 CIRCADIAN TIMEKEEPER [Micractinium conductrix]|uniref:XAP5 CIRCADIAN TIMEKEEPER n=1 Tax=Micractinium conductrix TaxID=554055 RepID=A0A2P6VGT9_9CHLO|nr:XAP5 CIRCADIAN TIMEKEEPER [Micractinium conductrix]|eukprot:PSC73288.1 XAP5 CIRCADIAN TIMEKEEPER [Micractinium conductrix]
MSNFGMGGYVGSAEDQRRIERQLKEREEAKKDYEEAKKKAAAGAGLRQFGAASTEAIEHAFKNETVGLVTREQFVEKRTTIEERLKEEQKRARHEAEEEALREKDRQRAKKAKSEQKHKLSFDDFGEDEEEDEDEEQQRGAQPPAAAAAADGDAGSNGAGGAGPRRYARLGKDPSVRTDFLPDRDREREEEDMREKLKAEYALRQAAIRAEPLEIIYSYYNGTGHRRVISVSKGDTVGQFLKAVIEQLMPQFREIRTTSVQNLMYVKEDIILPHTITFYDLIINKAQGKSGPLFQFDLHEHAAAQFDPRIKSQDSHAGKVVDRHWYNKNKHIYPASRWAPFDEAKQFGKAEGTAK